MGYIGVITHLLTIDPNFQRDIQVIPFILRPQATLISVLSSDLPMANAFAMLLVKPLMLATLVMRRLLPDDGSDPLWPVFCLKGSSCYLLVEGKLLFMVYGKYQ